MEKKMLYSDVTAAVENLTQALRKFSGESVFCNISIVTREDTKGDADSYTIKVHMSAEGLPLVFSEAGYIVRDTDGMIAKVERLHGGVEDD